MINTEVGAVKVWHHHDWILLSLMKVSLCSSLSASEKLLSKMCLTASSLSISWSTSSISSPTCTHWFEESVLARSGVMTNLNFTSYLSLDSSLLVNDSFWSSPIR